MAENIPNVPGGAVPPKKETGKVQPKKETVRINLPPKPSAAPTIKLPTLPPGGPAGGSPGAPAPVAAPAAANAHAAPAAPRAVAAPTAATAGTAYARRRLGSAPGRRPHGRRLDQHAGQGPRRCCGHCRPGCRGQHGLYSAFGIAGLPPAPHRKRLRRARFTLQLWTGPASAKPGTVQQPNALPSTDGRIGYGSSQYYHIDAGEFCQGSGRVPRADPG